MPWFKVDDGFTTSKAVLRIPRKQRCQTVGLWTLAGAWCAKELTDGFVPDYILDDLGATKTVAQRLVAAGLWETVEGGWKFVGWDKYQPTRAQVLEERTREAERKRKWREAKKAAQSNQDPQVNTDTSGECPTGTSPSVPVSSPVESVLPDPTRPDPSRPLSKESSKRPPRGGHRAPTKSDAAKPKAVEQAATENAYERVGKAFNFMAVRQIAKWAIHDRGTDPTVVEDAIVAIYEMGKPITRQVFGQYLDGHFGGNRAGPNRADQKVQGYLDYARNLTNPETPRELSR